MKHEVELIVKMGLEAKNYESLGEANKLKPLEIELRRLEDLSEAIVQDFAYMRKREEEMRDTNGQFFLLFLSELCLSQFISYRIYKCTCPLLQCLQHVLFDCFSYMAGSVPAPFLQGQEAY